MGRRPTRELYSDLQQHSTAWHSMTQHGTAWHVGKVGLKRQDGHEVQP
jgi:hypothetical protein